METEIQSEKKIITTATLVEKATTPIELTTTPQQTLFGAPQIQIKQKFILSENQLKIMEFLYLNKIQAWTPSQIYEYCDVGHENAVHRFIKRAKKNDWIKELKVIEGTVINNAYCYWKDDDKLENGQVIKDHRFKHYQITQEGMKIFEINEKCQKGNAQPVTALE